MVEVEITNYQSIAHAKLVIDGFTTLVGKNSLGKSAVLRAINAALTNQQGTDFIKWGEKFCEVRIKSGDTQILWHKEEGNNFYKINDDPPYTKIGRDEPPSEVMEAGFKLIKAGDQKINLNYSTQFNPLFLVDKLDSKGADLLTSVYGLDRLYKAIDLCNKAQRETADELRMREKDLSLVDKDLERFKDFEEVKAAAENLKVIKRELEDSERSLYELQQKWQRIQDCLAACKRLQDIKNVILPKKEHIASSIADFQKLSQLQASIEKLTAILKRVKPVLSLILPTSLGAEISRVKKEYEELSALNRKIVQAQSEVDRFSAIEKIILPVSDIDIDVLSRLKGYLLRLEKEKKEFLVIKTELEEVTQETESLTKERSQYKICPLCKNELK
jgi:DNA repair ATPase RecN